MDNKFVSDVIVCFGIPSLNLKDFSVLVEGVRGFPWSMEFMQSLSDKLTADWGDGIMGFVEWIEIPCTSLDDAWYWEEK